MEHRVRVTYDRETVAHAARQFALRSIRRDGFVAFFVLFALLLVLVAMGERSWLVGALGAVAGMFAIVGLAMFVVPYRRAVALFDRMSDKSAEFVFTNSGLSTHSDLGNQEVAWRTIDSVWRSPRIWLLRFVGGRGYMTLPIANMDQQTRTFVLEQITLHGGRIS